jgi:hypothetical protein
VSVSGSGSVSGSVSVSVSGRWEVGGGRCVVCMSLARP